MESTLAVELNRRSAVTLVPGSLVEFINVSRDDIRMVDVLFEGRTVSVFATDLQKRGRELTSAEAADTGA